MTQSKTKLYELINNSNYPAIALSDVNVELVELQPAAGGAQYNTRVTVRALENHSYLGERALFYKRVPLDAVGDLTLDATNWSVPQDLLDTLNSQYRAFLDLADLELFELPDMSDGPVDLELTAAASSYGWTGSVTIHLHSDAIPDCDGPLLPLPTLQSYNWWTTVDAPSGPIVANRYGGLLAMPGNRALVNALSDQGSSLWAKTFASVQYPDQIAIDAGAAYQDQWVVALEVNSGANWVFALAWLNAATGAVTRSRFFDTNPTDNKGVYQIAPVDGCVFVAAYDYPADTDAETAVVFKVRQDGTVSWQRRLIASDIEGAMTEPALIAAHDDNHVYVLIRETTTDQWWIVKYAGKGVLLWQRKLGGIQYTLNMCTLSDGSLVLAAKHPDNTDTVVMRLNSVDGTELWCKRIAGDFGANDVAVDALDHIYVLGDGILFKLDATGTEVWSRTFDVTNAHSGMYNFDSMEVRDSSILLMLCDIMTQTTAVFSLPTDGSGIGLFNIPGAQVLYGINETDYLSDAAGLITNTAGTLTQSAVSVTAVEGDITAVTAAPAPNWTAARALSDSGPQLF